MNNKTFIMCCLLLMLQLFLWLHYFFKMVNHEKIFDIYVWAAYTIWYVYFNPLNIRGFSRFPSWVYYYKYDCPMDPEVLQWVANPFPWLVLMFFITLMHFLYRRFYNYEFNWFFAVVLVVLFLAISILF